MKTIRLDTHYQNVHGISLAPGTHEVQDDLARYLVDNGHAEYVDLPHAVDSEPVFDPLPEITEDAATEERPSSPVIRNKKRK